MLPCSALVASPTARFGSAVASSLVPIEPAPTTVLKLYCSYQKHQAYSKVSVM